MDQLISATRQLAKQYRDEANKIDSAWLKQADPRAVQGGDHCAEASVLRDLARDLKTMASNLEEI